jgi:hypothetical protein
MILPRRTVLTGLVSLVAAPAVVRADALMPIKVWTPQHDPSWSVPSFAVLSSEDPSQWSESDWQIAKAEAALPPFHRTSAGKLYLALRPAKVGHPPEPWTDE